MYVIYDESNEQSVLENSSISIQTVERKLYTLRITWSNG